ncbi:iron chaperone [Frondihabitans australicus]|uniref:YdhG-like domain-containing protein n=1 Tax=Frondihabitans australicus TaxID=386892 RepID=A0A495IIW7_9MICO|nr:DUF1801 domain-containing protein [Frondihabitans australicus]RKR75934.1 hypothetical protein C8E83_3098 [Frondihabitans australicus]
MPKISTLTEFLESIDTREHRATMQELLDWVAETWPALEMAIKWNQPMFLDHGTFIIGFSVFPKNIAVSPEPALVERMLGDIEASGYTATKRLFRIGWNDPIDHALLARMIETQIAEKADMTGLWRP